MESSKPSVQRGSLIVIEGLDRSGKSTQCQLLTDHLSSNGHKARYVKFPDRTTPTGKMINAYLTGAAQQDDHSIHLLFSANRWEAVNSIVADVESGTTVIVDRYSFSGAVYSAAKRNPDLDLGWAWCMEVGLPRPDIVFFLDISSADAARRGGYGEERYEKEEMQMQVRELFKELFSRLSDVPVTTVNAGQTLEDVKNEILAQTTIALQGSTEKLQKLRPLR